MLNYLEPKHSTNFYNTLREILSDYKIVKKNKNVQYLNVCAVFDIESTSFYNSNNEKQCCMYAWVFGINGRCIRGRTWEEFKSVIQELTTYYNLADNKRLIIYVHNLGYEFQWFKNYFHWSKVFSLDTRKPIYAITDGIEFRCSYLLSGYSLEKLGDNLTKYNVNKLVGFLDYKKLRHNKSILTENEWKYILNDGLVVMAHIQEEIERLGSINKLPLTKTGYVRALCRENCFKGTNKYEYQKNIRKLTLTPDIYKQLRRTYMGGFTHANINYVDKVIKDVHSFDFTSSYPTVMVSELFPMSKPFQPTIKTLEDFKTCLSSYCCMFDITFYNIQAKVDFENYISLSRCFHIEHYVTNNGRVIEADILSISLTELDFKVITQMYTFDSIEVSNMNCFYKGYLPKPFILTILQLYKDKTELKGVEDKEVEYMVSKGMINSLYGMCVTDICRDEIIYDDKGWYTQKANVDELIDKYNKDNQRFLYYAWGVWVTAYARYNLFTGILEFKDDYIYSDTDSIKVINKDKHLDYFNNYNNKITKKIDECLSYYGIPKKMAKPKTIKGIEKPLGVWDYEGVYSRFKTLGAKRYMTESNKDIAITIAGVSKSAGIKYLKHTYKTNTKIFNAFKEELYFPPTYDCDGVEENGSGKMCHTYIDIEMSGELVDYMGVKGTYHELSGVHLENTDYSLSLDSEFTKLLQGIKGGHLI